jgi:hypothetical protein
MCLLDPWIRDPGWGKKSGSGSGIQNEHPRSFFRELRNNMNSFVRIRIQDLLDPGSGMEKFGSEINIPDPQH